MKKKYTIYVYTLVLLLIGSSGLQAQDNYKFSYNKQTYVPLENATALNTMAWYDDAYEIPLDFPIYMFGKSVVQLAMSGGNLMGLLESQEVGMIFCQTTDLMDLAYPIDDDDDVPVPTMSPLQYKVEGDEGSRILKIEVKNAISGEEVDSLNTRLMRINYQVWFYETKKDIEIRYGENTITDFNLFFNSYDPVTQTSQPFFLVAMARATQTIDELFGLEGPGNSPTVIAGGPSNGLTSYPDKDMVYVFGDNLSTENFTETQAAMFSLYPNPTNDQLWVTVATEDFKESSFEIYNLLGQKVQSGKLNVEKSIDVSSLKSGVYLINIHGTGTARFIKK